MGLQNWSEADSETYKKLAQVAVPYRDRQIASLLTLIPFGQEDEFKAVELASGEGWLSESMLRAFPRASVLALDGSEVMRETTAARLAPFDGRVEVAAFDFFSADWLDRIEEADVVLSSLAIHHLDGEDKRTLYQVVAEKLSERGAFLIADIVEPQTSASREVFAAAWDDITRMQSVSRVGDESLYELFKSEQWNHFRTPDPVDKPSPLFEQLMWLKQAGLTGVDCFWMEAGHAIFGGYGPNIGKGHISYSMAHDLVTTVLGR